MAKNRSKEINPNRQVVDLFIALLRSGTNYILKEVKGQG